MENNGKVIVIAGPTACGKSETAIELSHMLNCEIVSADSIQCYKHLDIGSAKPDNLLLEKTKHYMINEYELNHNISVYDYTKKAVEYINDILNSGHDAIVCGGSGLYIDSIIYDSYSFRAEDKCFREQLRQQADKFGADYLYARLIEVDPEYAAKTHKNNIKRVIRALEYFHATNKKMSDNVSEKSKRFVNTYYFAIATDREELYNRINDRVDNMLKNGLLKEVEFLYKNYYDDEYNAFNSIGYSELISTLKGEINLPQAIELIKQHTRNYAKRQYTWFRANKDIIWLEKNSDTTPEDLAKQILKRISTNV